MYRVFKLFVYLTTLPFLLFVAFVFLVALLPSNPEPMEMVFKESCGAELPTGYVIIEREPARGFAPQGVSYSEKGVVQVHLKDAARVLRLLEANDNYKAQAGAFEQFIVGKKLGICKVSTLSGYINYQYAEW